MLGVIINHALQSLYDIHTTDFTITNTAQVFIMNACIVAVNCFVMISGYFRIKQSWKGFLNLYMQLLFYACLSAVVCIWMSPEQSLIVSLKRVLFPLTESGLWFIPAYVGLYLISPLLNSAFDSKDNKHRSIILGMLLLVDVYIGYMHQTEEVTISGYHLFHFIVLYWLGAWMREHKSYIENRNWGGHFCLSLLSIQVCMLSRWCSRQLQLYTPCGIMRPPHSSLQYVCSRG